MWKGAAGMAILLMVAPGLSFAAQINDFGGGSKEARADPSPAGFVVNLTVPAECHVRKVQMNVSTAPFDPAFPHSPEGVRVLFGDRLLYEFNETGFGGFGQQAYFSNGSAVLSHDFGKTGGDNSTWLRLPKKATVENATFGLDCSGGSNIVHRDTFTGDALGGFGTSVASAKDVNGDGYEDIIIGEPQNSDVFSYGGKAYVYFGGPGAGHTANLTLSGTAVYSYFGCSVAGAGDVNGDGYDDVIVGAEYYGATIYGYQGAAYIFFGGEQMDNVPDVCIFGTQTYGELGASVAGAGDVNVDGYDDVLVGEPGNGSGSLTYRGAAYLYMGGQDMDNVSDLVVQGAGMTNYLGMGLSGAGDLNGDGSADFMIGAYGSNAGGSTSGEADIFFGGPALDSTPDLVVPGYGSEGLGFSLAGAGDVNGDGYDDAIIGACFNSTNGQYAGAAYVLFGGKNMDADADVVMTGDSPNGEFGTSVTGGFDLNGDGYADVAVGSPYAGPSYSYNGTVSIYLGGPAMNGTPDAVMWGNHSDQLGRSVSGMGDFYGEGRAGPNAAARGNLLAGSPIGKVRVFDVVRGVLDPALSVASGFPWTTKGFINESLVAPDFSASINDYLRNAFQAGSDAYGNHYCDVPLTISCGNGGHIDLRPLNVTYDYSAPLPDFADELNSFITAHKGEADASGNLTAPLKVESRTPGSLRFTDLVLTIDEAPQIVSPVPDSYMDEDTAAPNLIDLYQYFRDDFDNVQLLNYSVVSATNASAVSVTIQKDQYLSVDALDGDLNDNWTGVIDVVVRAEDHWGSGQNSNEFRVFVQNVNDPPIITSEPPLDAQGGVEWVYRLITVDGDHDRLSFALAVAPRNMTINASTGAITWIPDRWGRYPVAVSVSDGNATVWQNFTLTVPDRPPAITSEPPATAYVGVQFEYDVAAEDGDGDALAYSLQTDMQLIAIAPDTGRISGIPGQPGDFGFRVSVSDGKSAAFQNFTLTVVWPNRSPHFTTNAPTAAIEGTAYSYEAKAYDDDHDVLTYSMDTSIPGLTIDSATGRVGGTPEAAGNFTVTLNVTDGRGGHGTQVFTLRVAASVPPSVNVITSVPLGTLRGTVLINGMATKGTRDIVRVEYRIDSNDWRAAGGNSSWNITLDTSRFNDGNHDLYIRAYDGHDYSNTAGLPFVVDNSSQIDLKATTYGIILVAMVIVAALAAAGAFLVWRKRRK